MSSLIQEIAGVRALVCAADGPPLASDRAASDLVGEALGAEARLLVIPVERLPAEFLRLSTGLAGQVLQKFVNYRRRAAFVGDISAAVAESAALADFVRESNRGAHVWFVADLAELEARLGGV